MSAQFIFLDHTVQWATVHWFFRAVSRMKKGMSQDSSNEKLGPSSFFRVANPVTAWPSFLYPPSQVSCKQQYIIQQETFQDTLNLWLNYKNSLITVRFHLWYYLVYSYIIRNLQFFVRNIKWWFVWMLAARIYCIVSLNFTEKNNDILESTLFS